MTQDNYSLTPGTIIQSPRRRYKIIKKLGQGGFGITYLVEGPVKVDNIVVNVRFALKEHFISSLCSRESATQQVSFSSPVAAEVQNSMRSFIKEASRLQDLNVAHRNIVKINEVFEANNTAYYVMEYLEGETLADYIEREGPLTFEQASYFLRPVAEAVAELHAQRLTHYDIKPANIILARGTDGEPPRPVLIDFGLSKHYDHEGHATSTVASGGYSPGYSPVEQYAGIKTFVPQADVYALAATLWHCLTGKAPAESVTAPVNTIDTALAGVASPGQINALRHAMAIVSEERSPDASAFVKEIFDGTITAPQSSQGSALPPPPPQTTRPTAAFSGPASSGNETVLYTNDKSGSSKSKKWLIGAFAVCLVAIIVILFLLPGKNQPEPVPVVVDSLVVEDLESHKVNQEPEVEFVDSAPAAVKVEIQEAPKEYGRTSYRNLDLATIYNGRPRFFSVAEWNAVPNSEKSKYDKKGIVVKGGSVPAGTDNIFRDENPQAGYVSDFIIELSPSDQTWSWNEAKRIYGNRMLDVYQAYCLANNKYAQLRPTIIAFGGNFVNSAWTSTEYNSSSAWSVNLHGSYLSRYHSNISDESCKSNVITVAPVPR